MALQKLLLFEILVSALSTIVMAESAPDSMPMDYYQRYFDNFTLSSRQFACSEEEQKCILENKLPFEGECYSVGEQGPCKDGETLYVDRREAERLGGHLRGTCTPGCEDPEKSPLAATGECLTKEEVESTICRSAWYLRAAKSAVGEWVCEWTQLPCESPEIFLSTPSIYPVDYTGVCYAPDFLRYPVENTTIPSNAPPDHPLFLYFADKSYLEGEFPCTEEEAECLKYGRILHKSGNCCSPTPNQWPSCCESGQQYHLADVSGGKLRGSCKSHCRDFKMPIAGTGLCGDYSHLSRICRWEWGMTQNQDVFSRMVCECSMLTYTPPPPPVVTPSADKPGYCKVPDFYNPVRPHPYDQTLTLGVRGPCSEEEYECLRQGKVLASGACHDLRTRGPCAPGELLLLDKDELEKMRLVASCVPYPCEEGSVLITEDGSCHTDEEAIRLLCAQQSIAFDEFGGWQCDYSGEPPSNLSSVVRYDTNGGECELPPRWPYIVIDPIPFPLPYGTNGSDLSASGPTAGGSGYGGY